MASNELYKELPYYIDYTSEKDREEIAVFLKKHFYPDEPICKYLGDEVIPLYENYVLKVLSEKRSFKAVLKENGEIIGVRLTTIIKRGDKRDLPQNVTNAVEIKLILFAKFVFDQCDVFELHPEIDVTLNSRALCVNRKYRGLGIAQLLMKRALDDMIETRIPLFLIICTSEYSSRVMRKMGIREVMKINYADYRDENGQQILIPDTPHKSINWFIKELSELEEHK